MSCEGPGFGLALMGAKPDSLISVNVQFKVLSVIFICALRTELIETKYNIKLLCDMICPDSFLYDV